MRKQMRALMIAFLALSQAAEKHDIIFLWGHNHTQEEGAKDWTDRTDTKLKDRFSYLLPPGDLLTPGDEIEVQGASRGVTETHKLNFIYANAGYIKLGYGTVLTFSGLQKDGAYTQLTLHRYAVDGVAEETEIGFTGKSNPYTIPLQKTLT